MLSKIFLITFLFFGNILESHSAESQEFIFGRSYQPNLKRCRGEETGNTQLSEIKEIICKNGEGFQYIDFDYSNVKIKKTSKTEENDIVSVLDVDESHAEKLDTRLKDIFNKLDQHLKKQYRAENVENVEEKLELDIHNNKMENLHYEHIDRRTKVVPTDKFPWTVHGRLRVTFASQEKDKPGISTLGSAFIISPSCILTCAHNIYLSQEVHVKYPHIKRSFVQAVFLPNLQGTKNYKPVNVNACVSTNEWASSEDVNEDLAMLRLEKPIGISNGIIAVASVDTPEILKGLEITVTGYPGELNDYMYTMNGPINLIKGGKIYYDVDTTKGNSGSCIWSNKDEQNPLCIGVHTTGGKNGFNGGVCITTQQKRELILRWLKTMGEVKP